MPMKLMRSTIKRGIYFVEVIFAIIGVVHISESKQVSNNVAPVIDVLSSSFY